MTHIINYAWNDICGNQKQYNVDKLLENAEPWPNGSLVSCATMVDVDEQAGHSCKSEKKWNIQAIDITRGIWHRPNEFEVQLVIGQW